MPNTDWTPATHAAFTQLEDESDNVFPSIYYADLQAAIDACAAAGGGEVRLPLGPTYIPSGGVHLLSTVTLGGPHVRHANGLQFYVDGSGYYRPGKIDSGTGKAAADGAYLVPVASSTGPMIWTGNYDTAYAIRNVSIYGVDVYGQNIAPTAIPSWTNSFCWKETNGARTDGSPTLTCSVIQSMPNMVGKAITGTGIPGGTTVSSVNVGSNTITMSANATSTAGSGASFTVASSLNTAPDVPVDGRQAISFGSGTDVQNLPRAVLENVFTWGCGSGGPGTTANNRTWNETNATTTSGLNAVTLSSVTVSPLMIGAPVTGTGIPGGAVVSTINPVTNKLFLSANATANGTGVALTIGGSSYTGILQAVYTGTPAIYLGVREWVVRGVTTYMGGGDGLVIDGGDGHMDGDNLLGFNSGWGLRTTVNGGPIRSVGAIDSYQNGIYGGAGNAYIEGAGHVFMALHCNTAGRENLKFGRCINTFIYYLNATDAGLRFSTESTRYNSVSYAAPAASASNPLWNTGANSGVTIFGGNVETECGFENHLFGMAETVSSFPIVYGMFPTGTVWSDGTPDSSAFALIQAFTSSWRFVGGTLPQRFLNGLGLPPFFRGTSTTTDQMQIYSATTGTAVAGFGGNGALYQNVNAQTLSSNGAVTFDASKGNTQPVTLAANATSSSITSPKTGQVMTIEWIQDGTGSRTYVWPTNCKFAGGAAPTASTTANWRDAVVFRYDGTNWYEISRSVAVR